MKYNFKQMNKEYAEEIAYQWKYKGVYSFYDITADEDDLEEFLDPNEWENSFVVLNENEQLIGFYSYYFKGKIMWIGFGLKPELTGKGYGADFVDAGIEFGIKKYNYDRDYLMLAVAKFNQRAVKVYQKLGFKILEKYLQETNGGEYEFYKMKLNLDGRR
jgi:ribosomal-protein-alanine N-acetyltransferase